MMTLLAALFAAVTALFAPHTGRRVASTPRPTVRTASPSPFPALCAAGGHGAPLVMTGESDDREHVYEAARVRPFLVAHEQRVLAMGGAR